MSNNTMQLENAVFIAALKRARLKTRLNRQQLADRMGTSEATVSGWEDGERLMDFAELRQFCIATEITIFEFIDELELVLSRVMNCQDQIDDHES